MAPARLLVVAPEGDLRRSVVFALEAEGHQVTTFDRPPSTHWLAHHRFDCTVLQQDALTGEAYEAVAFCIKAHPVVLIAARPHPWLIEWVSQVVDLPVLGNAVTDAVRDAILVRA